jgi:MULE transposase domain
MNTKLEPELIMTDFEMGAINAFRKHFPASAQKACIVHLKRNVFKRLTKRSKFSVDSTKQQKKKFTKSYLYFSELKTLYGTDVEFARECKKMFALSYLPAQEIPAAFIELKKSINGSKSLPLYR